MKIWLLTSVLLVFLLPVNGQEDAQFPIKISGVVFDSDSLTPLSNVHLRIDSRNIGSITNIQGRFSAFVQSNDTIKFSYVGYKELNFIVSDTLLPGEYVVGIILSRDTILLKEVVIVPRRKDLRKEFMNIKHTPDPELDNAKRNLAILSYQGVAGKGIEWDADESYKRVEMRQEMAAMNMGMVAPTEMVGINFLAIIPYMIFMMNREELKPSEDVYISDSEYQILLQNYKNQVYNRKFVQDSIEIKNDID